jgi:hypothetical protein
MWLNKVPWSTIRGRLAILAMPITYMGLLWIFFNATIMHDALYFANGPYSNSTQIKTGAYAWWGLNTGTHSVSGTLHVISYMITSLFPPFVPALALLIVLAVWRRVDTKAVVLLGASVAVPLLQMVLLYKGETAVWSRFFMSGILMGFVIIAYLASRLYARVGRRRVLGLGLSLAVGAIFMLGDVQNLEAISLPRSGHGIYPVVNALLGSTIPVVVVGGSAAAGQSDPVGQSYIVRALNAYQDQSGQVFLVNNKAHAGTSMTAAYVRQHFMQWMRRSEGGVAVLAWGALAETRHHISGSADERALRQQIHDALATKHTVLLVSPPATLPGVTSGRAGELRVWALEQRVARSYRNAPIHLVNVFGPEERYLLAHGQTVSRYMSGNSTNPNAAGYALASHVLERQLVATSALGNLLGSFVHSFSNTQAEASWVLSHTSYGTWAVSSALGPSRAEAAYINAHPHWKVLLDTFNFWGVIPFVKRPSQVIVTADTNFQSILHNPRGRVNIIFDRAPAAIGSLDAVDLAYPTMYNGGLNWVRLVRQFPNTRIYEVLANAP